MTKWLSEYSLNITPDFVPKEDPAESALSRIREKLHQLHQQQDNICKYLEKGIYTVEMFTKATMFWQRKFENCNRRKPT